jgi:hypothetical protein
MGSLKLWGGLAGLIALMAFIAWIVRTDHLRARYKADIASIGETVLKEGPFTKKFDPTNPKHIILGVQKIATMRDEAARDRDTYKANAERFKGALLEQTTRIAELGRARDSALAQADQARKLAAQLRSQRSTWIARAQAASTRTERRACEAELAEIQADMDQLYQAGF